MVGDETRTPTGVLVVAAWREGAASHVAARITYSSDVTRSDRVVVVASGLDEITAVVRGWLEEMRCARAPGDGPVTEA